MVNAELSIGISETLDILKYMEKSYVNKIPKKFKDFLEQNQSTNYISKFDHTKKLKDLPLKEKTKDILALIYMQYWCSPEEKKDYIKLLNKNQTKKESEMRQKYNPDNLFKKQENVIEKMDIQNEQPNLTMIEYKESIFSKILNKIKSIFNMKL